MSDDITREIEKLAEELGADRKRSIGEIAKELKVEPHVIRFWEEHFSQIKPEIGRGGRRYYYNKQLKVLKKVKKFLYEDGYTVAGLQKLLGKRKHDSHKDEDLDIILSEQIIDIDSEIHKAEVDFDDFIDPNIEIKTNASFNPKARLMDFSNIKVSVLDPRAKEVIDGCLERIRNKLKKLRGLVKDD